MKRTVIFLVAIIFISPAFAGSLKRYYKHIYRAEEAVVHDDMETAAINYKIAFRKNPPLVCDVYNNLLVSIKRWDMATGYEMTEMLVDKGADSVFLQSSLFVTLRAGHKWKDIEQRLQDKDPYRKRYKEVQARLDALLDKDQEVTLKSYKEPESKEIKNEAIAVYRQFRDLYLSTQYLNESIVGACFIDSYLLFSHPSYAIAIHAFEDMDTSILYEDMVDAMHKGAVKTEICLNTMFACNQIKYLPDYYVKGDSMFKEGTSYDDKLIEIFPDRPSKREKKFRKHIYADRPDNVEGKLVCHFRRSCHRERKRLLSDFMIPLQVNMLKENDDDINNKKLITTRCVY